MALTSPEADLHGEGLDVDEVKVEHVELGCEAGRVRVRPDREGTRSEAKGTLTKAIASTRRSSSASGCHRAP